MPIYEYRCSECKHELEVIQKISEQPLVYCPECGKSSLVKLISAVGFRLKGGGWYETDFKAASEKKRNIIDQGADQSGQNSASNVVNNSD